jgi:tetratricopeptide (TPR) repeat protein
VIKYLRSDTRKVAQSSILAERAFKARDYAGGERLFRESHQAAARMPDRIRNRAEAEIAIGRGHSLYRLGRLAEAEDQLRAGIPKLHATRPGTGHPLLAHAYMLWGDLCLDSGRYAEAETHHRKALEVDEGIGNLAMVAFDSQRLAHALILQSRREEAAAVLERCAEIETRIVHEQLVRQGKDPGTQQIISMSLPDIHFCHQSRPTPLMNRSVIVSTNSRRARLTVSTPSSCPCQRSHGRHRQPLRRRLQREPPPLLRFDVVARALRPPRRHSCRRAVLPPCSLARY